MPMSVNEIQQAANCANWAVSIESENLCVEALLKKTIPDSVVRSKRTFRTLFPAAKPVPTEQL